MKVYGLRLSIRILRNVEGKKLLLCKRSIEMVLYDLRYSQAREELNKSVVKLNTRGENKNFTIGNE